MKNKANQINVNNWNHFLMICCLIFTFSLSTPKLIAQTAEKADSCNSWQLITAKINNSKVALTLSNGNDGQRNLKWTDRKGQMVMLNISKAKAPINAEGKIEICTKSQSLMNFKDSYSITELKKDGNLIPGLYAIRVIIGYYAGHEGESSNWITIQIK